MSPDDAAPSQESRYVGRRIEAWRYLFRGADMITVKYRQAGGKAFEVPGPDHSHIFISSNKHMNEIRKAGADELSLFGATKQAAPYHHARYAKNCNGDLHAYGLNKKVLCKLNGVCFFGDELAQNELFMKKIFEYNELVISAAEVLRVMPEFLKKIIGPYVGRHTSVQDKVFNMINDVVARRLEEKKLLESGQISSSLPNDMIQWIIDTAPPKLGWGSRRITYEIIAIWFGSVHALSATVTYVMFDLCAHPEYVEPLRKEVESPEFDKFMKTTKGLPLLDSFIKESSRLSPIEAMSGRRQALKDFVFSDGTQVKKGDWTCVPAKAVLNDESFFPSASNFEGFRFAPRENIPKNLNTISQPEGPSRYSDLSENYHAWGIGGIVW
ncbi:hypothetical protein FHL15_011383 [Xylaria flabelliformis]|uniref:Cytochrome P450 n=1 Tax=Xylaria flabelliformis TaxID=2512241 RepID=A0A553HIE5_9PEZI|nr:hypothetical protein FHL15_011383 [Xylaria flabelliformis]